MTAEIAVINPTAVALAADSAVTIGNQKIYNSALKLFSLSKVAPVGIMIYGSADLLGMPWELIIKLFRRRIGNQTFEKLENYCDDFFDFIKQSMFFDEETQDGWILSSIESYFDDINNFLKEKVTAVLKEDGEISSIKTSTLLKECVFERYELLNGILFIEGMDEEFAERLRKKYKNEIAEIIKRVFENIDINKETTSKLYKIASMMVSKRIFSGAQSGIVIAGFGEADLFPGLMTYEIEGVVENKLKLVDIPGKSQKSGPHACTIIPFAQEDMVATFMQGIEPSIQNILSSSLSQLFSRIPDLINDKSLSGDVEGINKTRKQLREDVDRMLNTFLEAFSDVTKRLHVDPIMNMVYVLPKDELGIMAETLVNLTAFKRKMTHSLETVGGPVDVAIISKGDGLVWVKRKHYFPAELNQHFFSNYYRGLGNGEKQNKKENI